MKTKQISKRYLWDKIVSPYIRNRDLDWRGQGHCISCGKLITYNTCDAGHFIRKSKGEWFYWNPDNIHAQCRRCNSFGSNETGAEYYKNLCVKIGKEKTDSLLELKNKNPKESRTRNEIRKFYEGLTDLKE
jgi:hypothetical protein